jgi:glycosyltransferase involved in cell wall biosynthesis
MDFSMKPDPAATSHGDCTADSATVWIVSELYYPEQTSTGHILTRIAEGLASHYPVRVLAGQPTYSARGIKAAWRERHNNVDIRRCYGTTWNKDRLPSRLMNLVTISGSLFLQMLLHVRRNDRVLTVTNPPSLPFLAMLACRWKGARCVLLIHDVYPEAAVVAGLLRPGSLIPRFLDRCVRWLYRSVDKIIVLGRDMQELVRSKIDAATPIDVITNWADLDSIHPMPRDENPLLKETGLTDKFVIQYAGNMGAVHDIETLVRAAVLLRNEPRIHFLMIGSGSKRAWLQSAIQKEQLTNITILPPRPRNESLIFLNACDAAISVFPPGMLGVSVPSRTYNILASGKPIVAVADPGSELALVIDEEQIGWVVKPRDAEGLAAAIRDAASSPATIDEMGRRARRAAEAKYRPEQIIDKFVHAMGCDSPRA